MLIGLAVGLAVVVGLRIWSICGTGEGGGQRAGTGTTIVASLAVPAGVLVALWGVGLIVGGLPLDGWQAIVAGVVVMLGGAWVARQG